jgi:uncharacterized membrane protein
VKIRLPHWLIIIDVLSIILLVSIIFIPSNILRIILGLPFLLYFPGYTLLMALFLHGEQKESIETIALSCVTSVALVSLIGLIYNLTSGGILLKPILITITAFVIFMSIIAIFRNLKFLKFILEFNIRMPVWETSKSSKLFSLILVIFIFSSIGTIGYIVSNPKGDERFTEFYILGLNNKAADYPYEFILKQGQVISVTYKDVTVIDSQWGYLTVGITNHEKQIMDYVTVLQVNGEPVDVYFDGKTSNKLGPLELKSQENFERQIGFAPKHYGDAQKVELFLYKNGATNSDNRLQFLIDVK